MKLSFAVAFLVAAAVTAQQPIASSHSQATVEHRDGSVIHVTQNNTFEFVRLFDAPAQRYDDLLLEVRQRNEVNFEADGERGSLKVNAWRMRGPKRSEPLWSFAAAGDERSVLSDLGFYRATSSPCCSAMWVHEYFSLTNGAHLYTTNGGRLSNTASGDDGLIVVTRLDHQDERFVAFGASYVKGHERPTIQYGTSTTTKQRIELQGHDYGDNFDVPAMSIVDDRGEPITDVAGAFDFTVVLRFNEADDQPAAELRIPVVNDAILPQKAVLPKGYSLVELRP